MGEEGALPASSADSGGAEGSALLLHLEVFINGIISGHSSPESKEVFLMKIMFPALKTLANAAVGVILRRRREVVRSLRWPGGRLPWMSDSDEVHRCGKTSYYFVEFFFHSGDMVAKFPSAEIKRLAEVFPGAFRKSLSGRRGVDEDTHLPEAGHGAHGDRRPLPPCHTALRPASHPAGAQ